MTNEEPRERGKGLKSMSGGPLSERGYLRLRVEEGATSAITRASPRGQGGRRTEPPNHETNDRKARTYTVKVNCDP